VCWGIARLPTQYVRLDHAADVVAQTLTDPQHGVQVLAAGALCHPATMARMGDLVKVVTNASERRDRSLSALSSCRGNGATARKCAQIRVET
jgi:hypothetical protein